MKKVYDNLKETGLFIVTFAMSSLPSELDVGYEKVRIRPYIPLPLKCNNCFQYGHVSKICKNENICYNFSCLSVVFCFNQYRTGY